MMNYYYLTPDKKTCGPLPLKGMCEMAEQGQLSPSVLVAKDGDAAWRPLLQVAAANGIEITLAGAPGTCPTCGVQLSLQPDATLPFCCPHCGRAFRPVEGKENNLWYNFTLALKQYAKFSGRATRMEYWSFVLFSTIVSFIPITLLMLVALVFLIAGGEGDEGTSIGAVLMLLVQFVNFVLGMFFLVPTYAVLCRRLHDVGWSGKWLLVMLGSAVVAVLCLMAGALVARVGGDSDPATMIIFGFAGFFYLVICGVSVLLFVLSLFDSQRGPNKYGPSRKYPLG